MLTRINEDGEVITVIDQEGREVVDPNPMEVPLGMKRPPTLEEQVKRLIRTSMSEYAAMHGAETFEESEDFDIDEPDEPFSPHEVELFNGMEVTPHDFADGSEAGVKRREAIKAAYLAALRAQDASAEFTEHVDEAYKEARKQKRAARPQSAPSSSEPPKGAPPAEQTPK